MACRFTTEARNIVVSALSMFFLNAAVGPAASIQNLVLADSTESEDINQTVGYIMNIWMTVGAVLATLVFVFMYRLAGLKATYGISLLLNIPTFASMIWIVNEYILYLAAFVAGIGHGFIWCASTMAIADNSTQDTLHRNMGFFWMGMAGSSIAGGVFSYIYMGDRTTISADNRITIYAVCIVLVSIGAVLGFFGMIDNKKQKYHQPLPEEVSEAGNEDKEKNDTIYKEDESAEELALERDSISTAGPHFRYYLQWLKDMVKRKAFWLLLVVNVYWAIMWGFYTSILPTAIGAVFEDRQLAFVPTICVGVVYMVGTVSWPQFARLTNGTCNMFLVAVMLSAGTILAILIFPTDGAVNVDSTEDTYITPQPYIMIICASLLGLGDCGFTITYYMIAGKVFADDTAMGYSVINFGFWIFYIMSMILPPLVSLHVFLYIQEATIVLSLVCVVGGLRKYLD